MPIVEFSIPFSTVQNITILVKWLQSDRKPGLLKLSVLIILLEGCVVVLGEVSTHLCPLTPRSAKTWVRCAT
jgi:hypothetical protein